MARTFPTFSPATTDAIRVLGRQIAIERRTHRWTQAQLAERLGVSAPTIVSIERGSPTSSVGTVFEAAQLVGIPIVGAALDENSRQLVVTRDALLPRRIATLEDDDNDF